MQSKLLDSVFQLWQVPLLAGNHTPRPGTDDFGQEIKTVLLSGEINEKNLALDKSNAVRKKIWEGISFVHTPQNLKVAGNELGFDIKQVGSFYYLRDIFIRLWNGKTRSARLSIALDDAVERTHSSNLYMHKTSTTRTLNQLFNHWSGVGRKYAAQSENDSASYFADTHGLFDYSYVEGGNVFTLTNQEGEITVLIGEDHRIQTLLILELEGSDWTTLAEVAGLRESFLELTSQAAQHLSAEEIFATCEEMYSLGLLRCQGQTGMITATNQLNILLAKFFIASLQEKVIAPEDQGWFRTFAVKGGFVKPFEIGKDKWATARHSAAEFRAKLQIVHALMAKDFQVPATNLHYISQANYHLDAFLAPGPQRSVFLLNYAFAADLLDEVIRDKEVLSIADDDLKLLENYRNTSRKFDRELGGLLAQVEKQLENAGFTVIPTPGHFIFEPEEMHEQFPIPSEGLCINFINSINGWSPKTQSCYYVTHGLHAGNQVGVILMNAFKAFLECYVPDIQVLFVGYNPEDPEDYSEALDFWNRLETQSGVHCVTFPL